MRTSTVLLILVSLPVAALADGFLKKFQQKQSENAGPSRVEVYPIPSDIEPSSIYTVTVNGINVPTQKDRSRSYVHFAFGGLVEVEVKVKQAVTKHRLSPLSYGIPTKVEGQLISFNLDRPRKLVLHEVNSLEEKLFIIAEAFEHDPPRIGDPGVFDVTAYSSVSAAINDVSAKKGTLVFPPGTYTGVSPRGDMTIYLQGGAYVRNALQITNLKNLKIMGRGSLDGNGDGGTLIWIRNSQNILVEGVNLQRNGGDFHFRIMKSDAVTLENIKLLGGVYAEGNDGIDPDSTTNLLIDDIFDYAYDDAISFKGEQGSPVEHAVVRNSVFWNYKSALKLGSEARVAYFKDIVWENNDIVQTDRGIVLYCGDPWGIAWGASRSDQDRALYSDIWYRNIRIEKIGGESDWRLIDVRTGSSTELTGPTARIDGLHLQNITANEFSKNNSTIIGTDSQRRISNVTIDNLEIAGSIIRDAASGRIHVGKNVENLTFTTSDPAIVEVNAETLHVPEGKTARFAFRRSGDKSKELKVSYLLRGSALKEKDYRYSPQTVIIPANEEVSYLEIDASTDEQDELLETVVVSLEHSRERAFIIGPLFLAQMSIIKPSDEPRPSRADR